MQTIRKRMKVGFTASSRNPMVRGLVTLTIGLISFSVQAQTSPGGVLTSANCLLWVDAGDINGDGIYTNNPALGSAVGNWFDKSGNSNNLTQGFAVNQPTYNTLGGRSVLRWDNTGTTVNFLDVTTPAMLSPGTIFMAVRMLDASDAANCLFDRSLANSTSIRYSQSTSSNLLGYTKYGVSDYTSTLTSVYNSNVLVSYMKTSGSDNVDIVLGTNSVNLAIGSANPGLPLYVLGKNSTTEGMNAYVMEVIAYNTALTTVQKIIVDNYLSAKHGSLSIISDKYAGDNAANGHYDFEMGGVGTEASGSNTTVASSITGGLAVTMSTAMENGEYLMYAHQSNPTNSVNTTDVGGITAGASVGRWERIWYFDWTHVGGTNETVNLVFDYSDAGMSGTPSGATPNYKLVYRAGTSGNWTEVMNATSYTGDRVTFNGLVYTQGDGYYTIASANTGASPLPVELTSFSGSSCGSKVCVNWRTLTELNSDYFVIERSADGNEWVDIGTADATGGSGYSFTDHSPIPGVSYYRLKSVDTDQSYTYSKVIAVAHFSLPEQPDIYPNPAEDLLMVEWQEDFAAQTTLYLIQVSGSAAIALQPFLITDRKMHFDIRGLSPGVYIASMILPNGVTVKRKLVLR
jgi:hypothetical protein